MTKRRTVTLAELRKEARRVGMSSAAVFMSGAVEGAIVAWLPRGNVIRCDDSSEAREFILAGYRALPSAPKAGRR